MFKRVGFTKMQQNNMLLSAVTRLGHADDLKVLMHISFHRPSMSTCI